ncbi:MAG TPA: polyprenyl synthetase family protein [Dehalococcoidia bacterium]
MQPPAALTRYRRALDDHLRGLLDRSQPRDLYCMLRYHLGWEDAAGRAAESTGKRLRPALCLLACEASGGEASMAVPAASAVELVHNFSLVHDDVQDDDRLRHGRDTVWAVWGKPQAINAGDALLALAHLSLTEMAGESLFAASRLLNERTLEMVEGQVMDIAFEGQPAVSLESYLAMISRKTGALFHAALALGGIAAGAPDEKIAALGRCGRQLGLAFQVRDDMLGIWGDVDRTGKPVAADILRRKKSLPIVFALERATGDDRQRLRGVYGAGEPSAGDVAFVTGLLDSLGALAYCQEEADKHRSAALSELAAAGLDERAAGEIREVADFLLERDF